MTEVEHHKEGALGYTRSYNAYILLPEIDNEKCHTQTHHQLKNRHYRLDDPVVQGVYAAKHHTAEELL